MFFVWLCCFFVELNKNNLEGTPVFHILKGKTPIGDEGLFRCGKEGRQRGKKNAISQIKPKKKFFYNYRKNA